MFHSGAMVCLVCIEKIKRTDSIWSCRECYSSFHLFCAEKWAKNCVYQKAESHATNQHVDKASIPWCCPKCRSEYPNIPSQYFCFCLKEIKPTFNPWLIPHSCGEACGKELKPKCGHRCLLLCHPGPCPPCPKMVTNRCHCGQMDPVTRRCSTKTWSCNKPCGRVLYCSQHNCKDNCHPGECKKCPKKSKQKCKCGAETTLRACADPQWQCMKVCNQWLSCGHHLCQKICHKEECGKCPASGERRCPCGKTKQKLPCTMLVPSCGDTCGKQLDCGLHFCAERCHKGPCPKCLQFLVKQCRCGSKKKEMPCSKELTCESKCKSLRDCRRHTCNKKCCVGDCPNCERPCGRILTCHSHKCESRCHQGPCFPCNVTHTITCRCGKRKVTVPCGREKMTKPPKCLAPCKLQTRPNCHHPEHEYHKCHLGACPQCRQVCNIKLKCGHLCPVPCHDAVPVKIVDNRKRAGPWEPVLAPRIEIQKQPHPPCMVPVPVICRGKHETPNWPCSEVRPYSCGRKCGRKLACKNHTCELECHKVQGAPDNTTAGKNCERTCERTCSKPRPKGCKHECGKPCHIGDCAECRFLVRLKCHCGLREAFVECNEWHSATTEKENLQSCKNQCNKLVSCGHKCRKECHSGSCSEPEECKNQVSMRCPCNRIKKEIPCNMVMGKAVECDGVCASIIERRNSAQLEVLNTGDGARIGGRSQEPAPTFWQWIIEVLHNVWRRIRSFFQQDQRSEDVPIP